MKSRYKLRMIRLLILFALLIIADRHYQCNVEAANITELKNGAMRMSAKEITAQVSFGYRGYTKYGKDMKVSAVINNEGKPFSGKFRLTYQSGENSDMKMIQKSFVVGMQESKRVQFTIPLLSGIPVIGAAFKDVYPFEILILLIAVVAWYVLYKTRYGMNLRACGDNPHAVDAAGENVTRIRLIAVLVSGALSGLAGISFAYSISANFSSNIYVGYGYLAIAAMIFGNWKILPTLGSCLLFGFAHPEAIILSRRCRCPAVTRILP